MRAPHLGRGNLARDLRLGALSVFRRDQEQALGFRPGAKGVAGGIGLLQRRGVLNLLQQILRIAVEGIRRRAGE